MDRLIDHFICFEGDGIIKDYRGNYTQYQSFKKIEREKQQQEEVINKEQNKQTTNLNSSKKKMNYNEKGSLKN